MRLSASKSSASSFYSGLGEQLYDLSGARPALDLNFASNGSLVDSVTGESLVTFTRASSGTYVDGDGIIQTAGNNVARFDHNPTTGESLGLLVEESRENLIANSDLLSDFFNITAKSFATVTETAPDNGTQVAQIIAHESNQRCRIRKAANSANNITVSVFVKKDTHRYVQLGFGGNTNSFCATFDIEPGATNRVIAQDGNGTFTNIDAGYQDLANGWIRIWATGTTSGTEGLSIGLVEDDTKTTFNDNTNVFDGTESVYVWGAQYEDNVTFPTSYIRTTGSTATRSADVASITGTNFSSWYNQTEGTVFSDFVVNGDNGANQFIYDIAGGSDIAEEIFAFKGPGTDDTSHTVRSSSNNEAGKNSDNQSNFNAQIKSAFAVSANSTNAAVNQSLGTLDTSVTMPTVDNMTIGRRSNNTFQGNFSLSRLTYWPTRLSDDTLQTITR